MEMYVTAEFGLCHNIYKTYPRLMCLEINKVQKPELGYSIQIEHWGHLFIRYKEEFS